MISHACSLLTDSSKRLRMVVGTAAFPHLSSEHHVRVGMGWSAPLMLIQRESQNGGTIDAG